jgi:hypothetical protein
MTFGQAIEAMREGRHVARVNWNGKNMWIALQWPDNNSKITLPYIYMKTAQDEIVPWLASQSDILGVDWAIVN